MKKKVVKPKKDDKADKKPKPMEANVDQDHFDYGGLPKRDLKKNLGC